ncbi:hypothetical protein Jiend_04920 [Micromonospora endophytica]|nr:hypothetical protein Jiend_04920 [Micromonospora endophytica]
MSARGEAVTGADRRGTVVALVLASSTGGVGQHVRALARGLTAAGESVLVCGPAATQDQFDFVATGARFAPVEIPATPTPPTPGRSGHCVGCSPPSGSVWCTRTGCAPGWWRCSPGPPPRSW